MIALLKTDGLNNKKWVLQIFPLLLIFCWILKGPGFNIYKDVVESFSTKISKKI